MVKYRMAQLLLRKHGHFQLMEGEKIKFQCCQSQVVYNHLHLLFYI